MNIGDEYERAIRNHLKEQAQIDILKETEFETILNNRITKAEDHLASMMGRTGMDVSMTLMGVLVMMEKMFAGKVTREQLQNELRKQGARYFSTAIQKDKKEKEK